MLLSRVKRHGSEKVSEKPLDSPDEPCLDGGMNQRPAIQWWDDDRLLDVNLDFDSGELMPAADGDHLTLSQVDVYMITAMLTSH